MISWDCFDTLIARKYIYPITIFKEVAKKIQDNSFVKKRIEAGINTHKYEDIYKKLNYDPQIEIDTELEHCYPIVSNINAVKDKDIIVTDMYLPKDIIQKMLIKCGLNKDINIIVSFDGKQSGDIWKSIDCRHIKYHIGDNYESDYTIPQKYKIQTKFFHESKITTNEQLVYNTDKNLACWMRYVRLQNPYSCIDTNESYNTISSHLWCDQSNYNLPILALASKELEKIDSRITFNFRDCIYLKPLYDKITNKKTNIIFTSRIALKNITNNEYIENILNLFTQSIVVDLHGSGNSFSAFLHKHNIKNFTLINIVGGAEHQLIEPYIISIFETNINNGLNFEKHNFAELGSVLPDSFGNPYIDKCEHDINSIRVQREAIFCGINTIKDFLPIKDNRSLGNEILSKLSNNYTSKYILYR